MWHWIRASRLCPKFLAQLKLPKIWHVSRQVSKFANELCIAYNPRVAELYLYQCWSDLMNSMVLSTQSTSTTHAQPIVKSPAKLRIAVHIEAEVLDPEVARRKANVWLLMYAGNLLGAENPELVINHGLRWRVDVILTSPKRGHIGKVGHLCLDAITGEVMATETLPEELRANADALIAH